VLETLDAREREIAELTASGWTNREIAARLGISHKTVEWILTRVYRTLGVRSRTELTAGVVRAHMLVTVPPPAAGEPDARPPTTEEG
jgi:DNA-binding NarL/FixJ family response regulator